MEHLVHSAGRIRDIVRDDTALDACRDALSILTDAVGGEAATLVRCDLDGSHGTVASFGYTASAARSFREAFVRSPWFDMVVEERLPPTISTEPLQSFRRGWFYEEHVEPRGYRDGLSCALWSDGGYAGMLHISSTSAGALGDQQRGFVAGLAPTLAPFIRDEARDGWCPSSEVGGTLCELVQMASAHQLPGMRGVVETGSGWVRFETRDERGRPADAMVRTEPYVLPFGLSRREVEVLTGVALGMSNREVAGHLLVSERTVHSHVQHLLQKTGMRTRTALAVLAITEGLLAPTAPLVESHTAALVRATRSRPR